MSDQGVVLLREIDLKENGANNKVCLWYQEANKITGSQAFGESKEEHLTSLLT